MTDANHLRNDFHNFFLTLQGVNKLKTGPTYQSPNRGRARTINDFVYYRGCDVSLIQMFNPWDNSPNYSNTSDHSGILFKISNCAKRKGSERYFSAKLKDDPELLAKWSQAVKELNDLSYLRNEFDGTQLYNNIRQASDLCKIRNQNYVARTNAKYSDEQMAELTRIGHQIANSSGQERFRLTKHLKRTK